jgi:hypothetical protein
MPIRLESPYDDAGSLWLRGNLHTHTHRSDGSVSPQAMARSYAALGYDFLALSDHDQEPIPAGELDAGGMILLPAVEISAGCPHLLSVGTTQRLRPVTTLQALIHHINACGGWAILCHPNSEEDFDHHPWDLLSSLSEYHGIEIFNGLCLDHPGSHLALDKWDRLLSQGARVFGYANDDAHDPDDIARGWNMVRVSERTPEALAAALRRGSFYASSGVTIERIACEGRKLIVRAPDAQQIAVVTRHGRRICQVPGPELRLDASEFSGSYLRVECYGAGGAAAWTQPIYVRDGPWDALQDRLAELARRGSASLRALRADRPPALSGRADDPLWAAARPFEEFIRAEDGAAPPVRTEARAIVHGGTLFFAFRCQESLFGELGTGRGGSISGNDSVEMVLDPSGKGETWCRIVLTVQGEIRSSSGGRGSHRSPEVQARAQFVNDPALRGWSAEVAVTFGGAEVSLAPGARWGLHLCRHRFPIRDTYVWSWVDRSPRDHAHYGTLLL